MAKLAMGGIESLQRFGFIGRNIDSTNALDKRMPADLDSVQRGKKFDRRVGTHCIKRPSTSSLAPVK